MADSRTNIPQKPFQYIYVRNWDKWQSYRRDRGHPPWIKVHRRLMRDPNWVALTDAQKGQLVAIWMLAVDQNGMVPSSPTLIKRLCCLEHEPDLTMLISLGFLDAKMMPRRRQVVALDTDTDTDTDTDKKVSIERVAPLPTITAKKETSEKRKLGSRLPEDWNPNEAGLVDATTRWGDDGASEELENFRDYWLAVPGSKGLKLDWDRTWRRWCRNSHRGKANGNGFHREKSAKEKYGDLLQSLGRTEAGSDVVGQLPKLYPE